MLRSRDMDMWHCINLTQRCTCFLWVYYILFLFCFFYQNHTAHSIIPAMQYSGCSRQYEKLIWNLNYSCFALVDWQLSKDCTQKINDSQINQKSEKTNGLAKCKRWLHNCSVFNWVTNSWNLKDAAFLWLGRHVGHLVCSVSLLGVQLIPQKKIQGFPLPNSYRSVSSTI